MSLTGRNGTSAETAGESGELRDHKDLFGLAVLHGPPCLLCHPPLPRFEAFRTSFPTGEREHTSLWASV